MALRLSTGLRNAILDKKATANNLLTGTDISFEDGTGTDGRDRILRVTGGMGVFPRRGKITVTGSASNDGSYEILASAEGYVEVAADSLSTETAGAQVVLAGATGGSVSDLFQNCVIDVFSGSQPTSPNAAEPAESVKLLTITLASGAFSAGSPVNGINFGEVSSGILSKEAGETWSGVGIENGTAGWFRIYDNTYTTGESTTAVRMDGTVSTSGSQFNMTNTTISVGATSTVDSVRLTLPASS